MNEEQTQGRIVSERFAAVDNATCQLRSVKVAALSDGVIARFVSSADERRLAACWNALEGVSTEAVEALDAKGGVLDLARKAEKAALNLAAALHENAMLRETIERLKP